MSHRFASATMAGLIVHLQDGRIVEAGSHEELLAAGVPYAELFRIQAEAYQPASPGQR